ncbi:protein kinase [bacterium]|nr:protein kinase [bacterium]
MANLETQPAAPHPLPDDRALAQGLLAQGRLTREQLQQCLAAQQARGGPARVSLAAILVERGVIRQDELSPRPQAPAAAKPRAFVCLACGAMGQAVPGSPCPKCGVALPSAKGAGGAAQGNVTPGNVTPVPPGAQRSPFPNLAPSWSQTPPSGTPRSTPGRGARAETQQTVLEPVLPSGDGPPEDLASDLPLEVAAAANDKKRRVGKYVLVSELGRGGMGVVFKAYDTQLKRTVAIKMILDPARAGSEALRRFKVEASAAAKLRHQAIVAVYEVGEHEGRPFLVLELVEGGSLEQALAKSKMPVRKVVEIARDIALALDHAHENGVIHRDVKPENVLLDRKGKPHLMDFGLAREVTGAERMTKTGSLLGTPAYMAPEQASGEARKQGPHSDIYALGGVLYRMLVGRPPFVGDTNMEVMQKVLNEEPEPARSVDPRVPRELDAIALRCLEKKKEDRFETAGEVAEELRRWLEGEKIETASKGGVERATKGLRKNARAIFVGVVILVGVAGSVAWALHAADQAKDAQAEQERARLEKEREQQEKEKREAEARAKEARPKEIAAILERARAGKLEALSDYDEALEKLARPGDAVAVKLVAKALEDVAARLNEAAREVLLAARLPDDEEAREGAQPLEGLDGALDRRFAICPDELDPESASLIVQARRRLEARAVRSRPGTEASSWAQVALAQTAKLGPGGLRLEKLSCEALSRMKVSEGAVAPLAKLLFLEEDDERAFDAAATLLRLGGAQAERSVLQRRKQLGPARPFWKKVASLLPKGQGETAESLCESGQAKAAARDHAGAIADFSRALELQPSCAEAFARRAISKHSTGDVGGCVADSSRAVELGPELGLAWASRALARIDKEQWEAAIKDAAKAIELAPDLSLAWGCRANARRERRDADGALADAERALSLDAACAVALEARGTVRFDKGDMDGAIADLSRSIELEPNRAPVYSKRGRAKLAKKDPAGSIADDTRAVELDPKYGPAWNNRSFAKRLTGDQDGAIADATCAIENDGRFAVFWHNRALARALKGDRDGAIADQAKAIEMDPRFVGALAERAQLWLGKGQPDHALEDTTRALDLEPRSIRLLETRMFARIQTKDLDGALADVQRIIDMNPTYVPAWVNRGIVKDQKGDLAGALADYDHAISLDPGSYAEVYVNRAYLKQRKKDLDGARADLDRAIAIDAAIPQAWARRGAVRFLKGDQDGALSDSEKAIELAPKLALPWKTRAEVRRKKGDKKDGIADLEKFVQLAAPEDEDLPAVKKMLEELKRGR